MLALARLRDAGSIRERARSGRERRGAQQAEVQRRACAVTAGCAIKFRGCGRELRAGHHRYPRAPHAERFLRRRGRPVSIKSSASGAPSSRTARTVPPKPG